MALFVLVTAIVYVLWTTRSERTVLRRHSLERNLALAQAASRVIDEKCDAIRSTLTDIVRRELSAHVGGRDAAQSGGELDVRRLSQVLPIVFRLGPRAAYLELYDYDGNALARYPTAFRNPLALGADEILRAINELRLPGNRGSSEWVTESKDGFAIAVPIEQGGFKAVLVAFFRSQLIDAWVPPGSSDPEYGLSVFDGLGQPVRTVGPVSEWTPEDVRNRLSLVRESGMTEAAPPGSDDLALIGYANTRVPRWTVLVEQPSRTALVTIDRLANSLILLAFASVLFVATAAWRLSRDVVQNEKAPDVRRADTPPREAYREVDKGGPVTPAPSSPGRSFITNPAWKVVSLSVQGASHKRNNDLPCQDASSCQVVNGNILVGAVADGAGSAPLSAEGARVAAELAVKALAPHAAAVGPAATDDQWGDLLLAAMRVAHGHVEVSAAVRNKPARQLATTLILFVAMPDLIVTAQIGDGAVVFQDGNGTMRALTVPQHGEYVNTTTFLVSPDAFKSVQHRIWRGPYTNLAAFTDGLQMLALTMPQGVPHAPFFLPLFDLVRRSTGEQALEELTGFLTSKRITDRADDDLTLMLANLEP